MNLFHALTLEPIQLFSLLSPRNVTYYLRGLISLTLSAVVVEATV